jgi:hypothetical protein
MISWLKKDMMTADEALAFAEFQRPGVKLVVGPELAREEPITRLSNYHLYFLPGDSTWTARDFWKLLGFVPSLWAQQCAAMGAASGIDVSDAAVWRWLTKRSTGIRDVEAWVDDARKNPETIGEQDAAREGKGWRKRTRQPSVNEATGPETDKTTGEQDD